jgi:hypothetical protein
MHSELEDAPIPSLVLMGGPQALLLSALWLAGHEIEQLEPLGGVVALQFSAVHPKEISVI